MSEIKKTRVVQVREVVYIAVITAFVALAIGAYIGFNSASNIEVQKKTAAKEAVATLKK